jgi:sec-independent protein translocase protein TatB
VFDVGFPELVLVFIIGLLVLGPERLPKVAAEIGKWVGRARRTATELRRQLEREIELNDIQPPPPPPPASQTPTQPDASASPEGAASTEAGASPEPADGSETSPSPEPAPTPESAAEEHPVAEPDGATTDEAAERSSRA